MNCYKCGKVTRVKGARYCPICGTLLRAFSRRVRYTKLTDENQMDRVEKMLVSIHSGLSNVKGYNE